MPERLGFQTRETDAPVTPELRLLAEYVYTLQGQLEMVDWRVYVASDPPQDTEAVAELETYFNGAASAWIRVAESFWTKDPEFQREVVIHELLHAMFHDYQMAARAILEVGYIPQGAESLFRESIKRADERVVDRLSRAIAEDYAMPPIDDPEWRCRRDN